MCPNFYAFSQDLFLLMIMQWQYLRSAIFTAERNRFLLPLKITTIILTTYSSSTQKYQETHKNIKCAMEYLRELISTKRYLRIPKVP